MKCPILQCLFYMFVTQKNPKSLNRAVIPFGPSAKPLGRARPRGEPIGEGILSTSTDGAGEPVKDTSWYVWGFPSMGVPKNGWFLLGKIPSRNGWWFGGTPILGNLHMGSNVKLVWIIPTQFLSTFWGGRFIHTILALYIVGIYWSIS